MEMFLSYAHSSLYVVIYSAFAVLLNYSLNWRASVHYCANEAISEGNLAISFRRAGAQIGLAIAMLGVMLGNSDPNLTTDIMASLGYGGLAIIFIWTSLSIIDKLVLPNLNNTVEVGNGNLAVGVVEFATLVMTGFMAFASIYGEGGTWVSSIAYFLVGQASVVALVLAFEKLTKTINLLQNIKEGEVASGVYLASKILPYGLIMFSAIKGNVVTSNPLTALSSFLIAGIIGMGFLYVAEILIDKVIIRKTTIDEILAENNTAAALQLMATKVGMALILGIAIL